MIQEIEYGLANYRYHLEEETWHFKVFSNVSYSLCFQPWGMRLFYIKNISGRFSCFWLNMYSKQKYANYLYRCFHLTFNYPLSPNKVFMKYLSKNTHICYSWGKCYTWDNFLDKICSQKIRLITNAIKALMEGRKNSLTLLWHLWTRSATWRHGNPWSMLLAWIPWN